MVAATDYVLVVNIDGIIDPVTASYLARSIEEAVQDQAGYGDS